MLFLAGKRFVTELFVVDDKFNNGTTGVCCVIFSPLPSLLFTVDAILKNDYSRLRICSEEIKFEV